MNVLRMLVFLFGDNFRYVEIRLKRRKVTKMFKKRMGTSLVSGFIFLKYFQFLHVFTAP